MVRNAIEIHFRSSKMGGGGHHNGQPVNHSGIYTVFALGQIHQFRLYLVFQLLSLIHSGNIQKTGFPELDNTEQKRFSPG